LLRGHRKANAANKKYQDDRNDENIQLNYPKISEIILGPL